MNHPFVDCQRSENHNRGSQPHIGMKPRGASLYACHAATRASYKSRCTCRCCWACADQADAHRQSGLHRPWTSKVCPHKGFEDLQNVPHRGNHQWPPQVREPPRWSKTGR